MKIITDRESYLYSLLIELDNARKKHRIGIFKINEKMTKDVRQYIENYFKNLSDSYTIEIRKCAQCKNEYEIIITIIY